MAKKGAIKDWNILHGVDKSVNPADNISAFVSNNWHRKNPRPKDLATWGAFAHVRKTVRYQLIELVERCSDSQIGPLYKSGMNMKVRDSLGHDPLVPILEKIRKIKDKTTLVKIVADLHMDGFDVFWSFGVNFDEKNSRRHMPILTAGGLTLPDRDVYIKSDEHNTRIQSEYKQYIVKVLGTFQIPKFEALKRSKIIYDLEYDLAKISLDNTERRDIALQYNKFSRTKFLKRYDGVDFVSYFKRVGAGHMTDLLVYEPKFVEHIEMLFKDEPLENLKIYLEWRVIDEALDFLTTKDRKLRFDLFSKVISGVRKDTPLSERMVSLVSNSLPDLVGKLYIQKHFSDEAKRSIDELVSNVFSAFRDRVVKLDWMERRTKRLALKKLDAVDRKIAYPKKWRSYKGLKFFGDKFFENAIAIDRFEWKRDMKKIDKEPKKEWEMAVMDVNAYYHPNLNEICFPAGILQFPFFSTYSDEAVNYGAIGSVIAHELTHALDDQGAQYDAKGNWKNWWQKKDAANFKARGDVMRRQAEDFELTELDGARINGSLTLGENIADLGGLMIALDAYKRSSHYREAQEIDGITPLQRFFLSAVFYESSRSTEELAKLRLLADPHSPNEFRANGIIRNVSEFYEAFAVTSKNRLFLKESSRAHIW